MVEAVLPDGAPLVHRQGLGQVMALHVLCKAALVGRVIGALGAVSPV